MKEKDVIRALRAVGKESVFENEEAKNRAIEAVLCREIPVEPRGNKIDFWLSQIRFVNKRIWFWQGVWLLLFLYAVWNGNIFRVSNEGLCILSMAPPLLLLFTVEDVSRIYHRSMLEIEYATKYSLKKVVLVRMMLLSMVSGILLLGGVAFAGNRLELVLVETLVYGLTPFLLMTFLLLKLMEQLKGEQLLYVGISLYFMFFVIVLIGRGERFHIYSPEVFGAWELLFVGGVIAAVYQGCRLGRLLENFEAVSA